MSAPPLYASVIKQRGGFVVTVSDVVLSTEPDLVAATNFLCKQAAEHKRRVYVQVVTPQKRNNLEIDEQGVITTAAPPADNKPVQAHTSLAASSNTEIAPPTEVRVPEHLKNPAPIASTNNKHAKGRSRQRKKGYGKVVAILATTAILTIGAAVGYMVLSEKTSDAKTELTAIEASSSTTAKNYEKLAEVYHTRDAARVERLLRNIGGTHKVSNLKIGQPEAVTYKLESGDVEGTKTQITLQITGAPDAVTSYVSQISADSLSLRVDSVQLEKADNGGAKAALVVVFFTAAQ